MYTRRVECVCVCVCVRACVSVHACSGVCACVCVDKFQHMYIRMHFCIYVHDIVSMYADTWSARMNE